jgi:hypothetical protein
VQKEQVKLHDTLFSCSSTIVIRENERMTVKVLTSKQLKKKVPNGRGQKKRGIILIFSLYLIPSFIIIERTRITSHSTLNS